jgi:hypothetical protein
MTLLSPDARVAFIFPSLEEPVSMPLRILNARVIENFVPNINASFGDNIAGVLVLLLLWVAFERDMVINGHTLPIIPKPIAECIKGIWIAVRNPPEINPTKKISLAVQQLGNLLVIIPLVWHPAQQPESGGAAMA